jgi:CRISPR-associated protein Cmr2
MSRYWEFKIHAFLHDPPDKPLALQRRESHAKWAKELAEMIAGPAGPGWEDTIRIADQLAAGAERGTLLPYMLPSLSDLRHPLSGRQIDLSAYGEFGCDVAEQARKAVLEEIGAIASTGVSADAAFIYVWGPLWHRLKARQGRHELRSLWDWLPAETRMPNHCIAVHQSLTSAIGSILKEKAEPVLLSFSVGPVQKFIQTARRTSDLWGGSAMLSDTLFHAMIPIIEKHGPDHILFPALRYSQAFLGWLGKESKWAISLGKFVPHCGGEGIHAGFPNRFVAVLPGIQGAKDCARACEASARAWWNRAAVEAARVLERDFPDLLGFSEMARGQAEAHLQIYWAASPWPCRERISLDDADCKRAGWIRDGVLPGPSERFIAKASGLKQRGAGGAFHPNGGLLYAAAYDGVERLLGFAKRTRTFVPRTENGLKCSLCGERSVFPAKCAFEEQRRAWASVRDTYARRGYLRKGEALCGVCWSKRYYALSKNMSVPSTSEIAASPFKLRVLKNFATLGSEASALVQTLERHGCSQYLDAYVLPAVLPYKAMGGMIARFAGVAGEILLGYPHQTIDLEFPQDERIPDDVLRCIADLRHAAGRQGIGPPRPYLAAISMDGDEMGKWLSGEKNLRLVDYLSAAAAAELHEEGDREYLQLIWPMTPSMHGSFSEACASFSQASARRTLHNEGVPAFLVYSGGDDLLALSAIGCHSAALVDEAKRESEELAVLPLELATGVTRNLRLRFSGHVQRRGSLEDTPDPTQLNGFVIDPKNGLRLAFGDKATASAGIAVFHHKWPLARALAESRNALQYAKEEMGRDALGITILRRSGQVTVTGLRFGLRSGNDYVLCFQQLCHAFAYEGLSPRYLAEMRHLLGSFCGCAGDADLVELAKPLLNQAVADHCEDVRNVEQIQALIASLGDSAAGTGEASGHVRRAPGTARHLNRLIDLIDAAAFLARGDES